MGKRNYFFVASITFALAGLLHLTILSKGWKIIIGNAPIPVWVSGILVIVAVVLSWQGFKYAGEDESPINKKKR